MTVQIWKYPLVLTEEQEIEMPSGAKPLCVQMQGGSLCLWAMVDSFEDMESREVWIFGTGHGFYLKIDRVEHIDTVQDGSLVWHVFMGKERASLTTSEVKTMANYDPICDVEHVVQANENVCPYS